ncbi:MAG: response regulator, partial [Flammeovirgaceae bacterium]
IFQTAFKRSYNITVAASAEEAIKLLKENEFHLIITDQKMPKVTGVEFLAQILDDYPDPVRMILTGFSDAEAIIGAINTGKVYKYITKPWNKSELKQIIEEALIEFNKERDKKSRIVALEQELEAKEQMIQELKAQLVSENG